MLNPQEWEQIEAAILGMTRKIQYNEGTWVSSVTLLSFLKTYVGTEQEKKASAIHRSIELDTK